MEKKGLFNLAESALFAVLVPMIPAAIVGIIWLGTFGSFDYILVMRSLPMTLFVTLLAIVSMIAAIANYEDI